MQAGSAGVGQPDPSPQQPAPMAGPGGPPRQQARGAGPQLQPVTVEDIVETDVATAERDTPIATVVATLAEEDVGCVVVVEDDEPVGIVTDRAIALSLEDAPDVSDRTAGDIVGDDLVTATTDTSVFDALRRMSESTVRRLPIVDEEGALEGIVTLDDILVLLGAELRNAVDIIEAQSPRL